MSTTSRARITQRELLRLAAEEGQVVTCDRCDYALDRDGNCARCEKAGSGGRPAGRGAPAQPEIPSRLERPHAVDVNELPHGEDTQGRSIVKDLIDEDGLIEVAGEEGEGKTLLTEQIARQTLRGDRVLDFFEVGELRPSACLFVDTEMERTDAIGRNREAMARGLSVPLGRLFWLTADDLNLSESAEDRTYLEAEITRLGVELLWIDTGGNAVGDGKDDVQVRAFFNYLFHLRREAGVLAVGLTLQARKRAQGEYGRRFDDLFGSREWKGRAHKAFYIEGERITCWKDRGGHIRRLWPARAGGRYPVATLLRPGLEDDASVPFRVEISAPEQVVDENALRAMVVSILLASPDTLAKTAVADRLGVRRAIGLQIIERMLSEGVVGPDRPRARLRVLSETPLPLEGS